MSEAELRSSLANLKGWEFGDDRIKTRRKFANFAEALEFVNKVGALAEAADHHPDITFGWGYATISLHTHKIKGLHENDFIMAAKIDGLFDGASNPS